MSVPVVIQFLAETDDMLAQVKGVQGRVNEMITSAGATVAAVETVVGQAMASTGNAVAIVEAAVNEAIGSTAAIASVVEAAVSRAIAATSRTVASAGEVVEQTKATADAVVSSVGQTVAATEAVINQTITVANTAVSSVDKVVANASTVVESRFQQLEESARTIIDGIRGIAEEASTLVEPLMAKVGAAHAELVGKVQGASAASAAGFAALGAGVVVAGGAALEAGRKYEDLQARLRGLTGDVAVANQLFRDAVEFAAATPFSVEELVAATGQLKAFGQAGSENLKLVAEIAAASGQPVQETALRVGKALAGISEGFQGLRDTSGITAERLAKYGAVMNSVGGVSVQGAEQIGKARRALQELGRVEFGGNVERQSATYTGALSNAGDAVTNFAATIGEQLIPIATFAVRSFSALVGTATSVAQSFSFLILPAGVLAVAFSAVGTAVAAATGFFAGSIAKALLFSQAVSGTNFVLGRFGLSLSAIKAQTVALIQANDVAAASFLRLKGVVSGAATSLVSMKAAASGAVAQMSLFSPLGIAAIGVGLVAVNYGLKQMEENAKAAGAEILKSSKAFQGAANQFRQIDDLVGKISGADLSFGVGPAETAAEVSAALEGIAPLDILNKIAGAGQNIQSLTDALRDAEKASGATKAQIARLKEALDEAIKARDRFTSGKEGLGPGPEAAEKVKELEKALKSAEAQFQKLGGSSAGLRVLLDSLGGLPTNLENAAKKATSLDSFLKFASGLESTGKLKGALGEVNKVVAATQKDIQQAFGTVDRFELGNKLADPNIVGNQAAVKAIEEYLTLLNKRDGLQEMISRKTEEQAKKEIDAFEQVTERKKALGELTLQEERSRLEQQLALVEKGSQAEIKLLEAIAAKDAEILAKRESFAKNALESRISQIEESVTNVSKAPGAKAEQTSEALRDAIVSLQAFGRAQKEAFIGAPEAAEAYRSKLVELKRELASSEADELSDSFNELKARLDAGIDSSGTVAQQLVDVGEAILNLNAAIAAKSVEQSGADEYLAQLEEKKLDLIRQQTAEKLKQVDELAALQAQALDQEIQILETRLAAGEDVERKLTQAKRDQIQLRLEMIEQAKEREIAAGGDATLAERKATVQRETLYRGEALTRYRAQEKAAKDIEQLNKRGRGTRNGSSAVGAFQPGFSPAAAFGASPFSQSPIGVSISPTAIPAFAENFGRRIQRTAPRAPNFDEQLRQAQQKVADRPSASEARDRFKGGLAQNIVNNMTLKVDGRSATAVDQAAFEAAMKAAAARDKRMANLTGQTGVSKSGSPISYGTGR